MTKFRTHYDNLKIAKNAPVSVIKAAYKALCQTYHPDKFQGNKEEAERIMKIINASYTVLIDPVKREVHDSWIREQKEKAKQQNEKVQFGAADEATEQQYFQKTNAQRKSSLLSSYEINSSSINWHKRKIDIALLGVIIISMLGLIKYKDEMTIPHQAQTQPSQVEQKSQQTASLNINTSEDIYQAEVFNIENDIRNSAEILNKNLPMSIDRYTRLDSVMAGPKLLFTYNYTILTASSREIDQAYLQDNKHHLKAEICSQPSMKIFFENRVITRYSYQGSDGVFIGNIDITPKDCGYGT